MSKDGYYTCIVFMINNNSGHGDLLLVRTMTEIFGAFHPNEIDKKCKFSVGTVGPILVKMDPADAKNKTRAQIILFILF